MNLVDVIKKAAVEAVNAGEPSDFVFGTVTSKSPLTIQIDQKLILSEEFITLTSGVMDYKVNISINGGTKQEMTVYNGLKAGDLVIMLKSKGGQQYVVLDKIIKEGEVK
jgi:hypothetical protein